MTDNCWHHTPGRPTPAFASGVLLTIASTLLQQRSTNRFINFAGVCWRLLAFLKYAAACVPCCAAVKGVSAKADGAKVTPEDKWAADGLDITRLSPNAYGNSYKGVKGDRVQTIWFWAPELLYLTQSSVKPDWLVCLQL